MIEKPHDKTQDKYAELGVSSGKEDVHRAVRALDKGLYDDTFCRIFPDNLTGSLEHCILAHADGSGTKSIMAYHYWKMTGDISAFYNLAIDAAVMNIDDMICNASFGPWTYTQNINRNSFHIPYEVVAGIINGTQDFFDTLKEFGIEVTYNSGETADLNDAVRTITLDASMVGRMLRKDVVHTDPKPGHVIVGLSSEGQAAYEDKYNSGIGSNGITLARNCLFTQNEMPELYDPQTKEEGNAYYGKHLPNAKMPAMHDVSIGELVLSPTRSYAPIIKEVIKTVRPESISAMIHCTGGGQAKCLNFAKDVHIIKESLFDIPPIFSLIQKESDQAWGRMYKNFNMGHRFEIYCERSVADQIIEISESYDVEAQIIGHVDTAAKSRLTIESPHGTFKYNEKAELV